ncbi:MAG: phage minor capsid protein, partial [Clostridiales bacterium]|nr:phage minor capsid protein [Clostridiales bacterium]
MTDYASAIRGALREAGNGGLSVQYPSGLTRRLDSNLRQNVLDGVRSLNNDILDQLGNEYGADGVELSAHALCAEDHLPYQGRQFSRKAFERLQASLPRPIGMWNCKHTIFPVVLGVSEPAHTPEELAAYARNSREAIEIDGRVKTRYEWTQEQRRTETAIRRQKDVANLAKASGDDVLRREAQ